MTAVVNANKIDSRALLGAWRLDSFYIETSNGACDYPFGDKPQGILIYTSTGQMSAQIMRDQRPLFESGDQLSGSVEEMTESFKNCVSYFGEYEVNPEEGFVLHHVDTSLFPNWEGTSQKRFIALRNDKLRIATPPMTWGGAEKVAVLIWERIG